MWFEWKLIKRGNYILKFVLTGFFKQKEKKEKSSVKETDFNAEQSYPSDQDKKNVLDPRIVVRLEKLSAESEANKEIRSVFDERFARLDEQLGELKEMMLNREKEIEELEVVATKAADLVSDVQPQKLLSETKKIDIRVDALKAKIETYDSMNDSVMDELKKLRKIVEVFRGTEEIIKLNKDIREEIIAIQRVKAEVVRHSDKVESMYMDASTKFEDYKKYRDIAKSFEEKFLDMEAQFNKIKVKTGDIVTKSDYASINSAAELSIKNVEEALKSQAALQKDFLQKLETKTEKLLKQRLTEQKKQLILEMKKQFAKKQASSKKKRK